MAGIPSAGRRRTQIRRIRSANAQQVAFSKRHSGLVKKASELCTLCAVEAAFAIFSPGVKAFISFGHPSVGPVVKRIANFGTPASDSSQNVPNDDEATLHELNKQYSNPLQELEAEKKWAEELKKMRMEGQKKRGLMIRTVEDLSLEELVKWKATLDVVLEKLKKRVQGLLVDVASPTPTSIGVSDASICDPEEDSSADSYGHDIGHED
ncbi:hypothetical protein SLE2022_300290 [Rubroshorea leprosula]